MFSRINQCRKAGGSNNLETSNKMRVSHYFKSIWNQYSAVSTIVIETCQAIAEKLLKKCVFIPQGEGLQEIVRGFENVWGFPKQLEQLMVLMFRSSSLVKVRQITRILLYYSPRTS